MQGPARPGVGAAAARSVARGAQAQSPLTVESIPEAKEEDEEDIKGRVRPLVGAVPQGKRRRIG